MLGLDSECDGRRREVTLIGINGITLNQHFDMLLKFNVPDVSRNMCVKSFISSIRIL